MQKRLNKSLNNGKRFLVRPLVSFIIPTYNHEKFIGPAIESALAQTYKPIEIIVINDGSTDGTDAEVSRFLPFGIHYLKQTNLGVSAALNNAYQRAQGDYIAFLSGDDIALPQRIDTQIRALENHAAQIAFSGVNLINEEGHSIEGRSWAQGLFPYMNGGQAAVLRKLFLDGNFLNAPSALVSRRALEEVKDPVRGFLFDPYLRQLQDFDLWCRIIARFEVVILKEALVQYRVLNRRRNLSAPRPETLRRTDNELFFMSRKFFEHISDALFKEAFGDLLIHPNFQTAPERKIEEALLFLKSSFKPLVAIGLEKISELLRDRDLQETFLSRYEPEVHAQLVAVLSSQEIFNSERGLLSELRKRVLQKVSIMRKASL